MTKSDLIQKIAEQSLHLLHSDVELIVNTVFKTMTDALAVGNRIEIRGFGSFTVRDRKPRKGRNPKTGERVDVPAKRVPFFTVGNELKQRVNNQGN